MKRILLAGDLHCGHFAGLAPPAWRLRDTAQTHKLYKVQDECWKWYEREIDAVQPIHLAVWNGDCIDGKGPKSGGTELITADREEQAAMAVVCIKRAHATHNLLTYGTAYHTGASEDFERLVANELGCKIGAHEWPEVDGVVLDCRHKVGGSSIPHGRKTAISRAVLWNMLWADAGLQPRADILVRSHVHFHVGGYDYFGTHRVDAMVLPALSAMGSKFGSRECEGFVHFGFVTVDIEEGKCPLIQPHLAHIKAQVAKTTEY